MSGKERRTTQRTKDTVRLGGHTTTTIGLNSCSASTQMKSAMDTGNHASEAVRILDERRSSVSIP
ncbi:hypothetical protein AZE42_13412 [Rhizopogon vesiculosus]|uniref:Uncharacterized protein n=1 Tax=Rhizopogon vesiculosus TaxID=180088 RepID=A0A1J8PIS7_9AGAM|nr:hypothetical protein AZE42_13412 [Rhizopogon vesiculosus]